MPNKQPAKSKQQWKAKYKGKWYEVYDVVDQGPGRPNVYELEEIGLVEKIDDLDMIKSSFLEVVCSHYKVETK